MAPAESDDQEDCPCDAATQTTAVEVHLAHREQAALHADIANTSAASIVMASENGAQASEVKMRDADSALAGADAPMQLAHGQDHAPPKCTALVHPAPMFIKVLLDVQPAHALSGSQTANKAGTSVQQHAARSHIAVKLVLCSEQGQAGAGNGSTHKWPDESWGSQCCVRPATSDGNDSGEDIRNRVTVTSNLSQSLQNSHALQPNAGQDVTFVTVAERVALKLEVHKDDTAQDKQSHATSARDAHMHVAAKLTVVSAEQPTKPVDVTQLELWQAAGEIDKLVDCKLLTEYDASVAKASAWNKAHRKYKWDTLPSTWKVQRQLSKKDMATVCELRHVCQRMGSDAPRLFIGKVCASCHLPGRHCFSAVVNVA